MKLKQKVTILLTALFCTTVGCHLVERKISEKDLSEIDQVMAEEIKKENFSGAVVLVGQADKVLYCRAFGWEVKEPYREKMRRNTIFDLASLTKPIATATSIMLLMDNKKIQLNDYVHKYLPAFACNGKQQVQICHLLTHTSGLPAYMNAEELKNQSGSPCSEEIVERICSLKLLSKPGEEFGYSCLGYILLAKIVEIVSGQSLLDFTQKNIFKPLKMKRTMFNPPESWDKSIAATEIVNGRLLRGTVHDPLARLMGGISGNAGLFSNVHDLSIYCRMLLNNGSCNGVRILSPEAVTSMTTAQSHGRAYGFDVHSSYSSVKGSYAPKDAFCHTGYTGTSIVCSPSNKTYVIILTNRSHPHDDGTVKPTRTQIADSVFKAANNLGISAVNRFGQIENSTKHQNISCTTPAP